MYYKGVIRLFECNFIRVLEDRTAKTENLLLAMQNHKHVPILIENVIGNSKQKYDHNRMLGFKYFKLSGILAV